MSNLPATITSGTRIYPQIQTRVTVKDIPIGTQFRVDLVSPSLMVSIDVTLIEDTITIGDQYYEY